MPAVPLEVAANAAVTTLVGLVVAALYRKLVAYMGESRSWRSEVDAKLDTQMSALQTTMRATLIHNAEKYLERGWITPEERASWCDMHDKYSALGANGLIETYRRKLDGLHDRQI